MRLGSMNQTATIDATAIAAMTMNTAPMPKM
jgi:hypothetical protein